MQFSAISRSQDEQQGPLQEIVTIPPVPPDQFNKSARYLWQHADGSWRPHTNEAFCEHTSSSQSAQSGEGRDGYTVPLLFSTTATPQVSQIERESAGHCHARLTEELAPPSLQARSNSSLFGGDEGADDDDVPPTLSPSVPYWRRHALQVTLWAFSLVVITVGVLLQTLTPSDSATGLQQMHRWFYFVGIIYPLWSICAFISYRVFSLVEYLFFHEALYYLATIAQPVRWMLLFTLLLPAHVIIFQKLWCHNNVCDVGDYKQAQHYSWRALVCFLLLSIVNFTKTLAAKLVSHHFYRTSYLGKVHDAIEKEYYLMSLSQAHDFLENRQAEQQKKKLAALARRSNLASRSALSDLDKESTRVHVAMDVDEEREEVQLVLESRTSYSTHPSWSSTPTPTPDATPKPNDAKVAEAPLPPPKPNELSPIAKPRSYHDIWSPTHGFRTPKETPKQQSKNTSASLAKMRRGMYLKTYTHLLRRARSSTKVEEEQKLYEAQQLGKDIFNNIIGGADRHHIVQQDMDVFFEDKALQEKVFRFFDRDGDGVVTKKEVKSAVVDIYKERKNMAATLQDTQNIVGSLETVIGWVLYIVLFIVVLAIFGINVWQGWSTFTATVLALAFVFGNSVKNIYESALFLLVEHPYDIGDLIDVDGKLWRVGKFDLMYTVLHALTGEKVYYPNTQLMAKTLTNLSTSESNRNEFFKIQIDISTPRSAVDDIRKTLEAHVEANQSDFIGKPTVMIVGLTNPLKMEMSVWWCFSVPPENLQRAADARHAILGVLMERLHELGIQCTVPTVDVKLDAVKMKRA